MTCLLLIAAGCRRDEPVPISAGPTTTAVTRTPTRSPEATATLAASPTPIPPSITAANQVLVEDGRLVFDEVTSPDAAWLVVYAQKDGELGEMLGFTAVAPGRNQSVAVMVDPWQATPEMAVRLHADGGISGEFEFPGPDRPLLQESGTAPETFTVDIELPQPAISISDQDVGPDGLVTVDNIIALDPSWVLIHADAEGAVGELLGFAHVTSGSQSDLPVSIRVGRATPRLYAVLHQDVGRPNRLDYPESDPPLLANEEPVVAPFLVTLPLDIYVLDQPVVNGEIVVERVVVNAPSWLVVYFDEDGLPGRIIGFAPLDPGVNEQVVVPVIETAVTRQLHLLLHEDTIPGDDFDFPANDPPYQVDGHFQESAPFLTTPGIYLTTSDQIWQLTDNEEEAVVTVPLVVTDRDIWLALYNDVEGQLGEIIGQIALPPGIHRQVAVAIDLNLATDTLHAAVHRDTGEIGVFDFPEGPDTLFGGTNNPLQSPFARLAESNP